MSFAISGKEVIVLGDGTSHGGKVITASSTVTHKGKPIARVGDSVSCPKCGGTHTIIEGAPSSFDTSLIARHGDAVSCGARLISKNGEISSGLFGFKNPFKDEESLPTKGLSADEICKKIADVMSSPNVQAAIDEAWEKTKATGNEYGFWIVENPDGTYAVPEIATSNDPNSVITPGLPKNRVAHFHTHPDSSGYSTFSDFDRNGASDSASHPLIFSSVMNSKGIAHMDDEGQNVVCGEEPRICKGSGDNADPNDPACF